MATVFVISLLNQRVTSSDIFAMLKCSALHPSEYTSMRIGVKIAINVANLLQLNVYCIVDTFLVHSVSLSSKVIREPSN